MIQPINKDKPMTQAQSVRATLKNILNKIIIIILFRWNNRGIRPHPAASDDLLFISRANPLIHSLSRTPRRIRADPSMHCMPFAAAQAHVLFQVLYLARLSKVVRFSFPVWQSFNRLLSLAARQIYRRNQSSCRVIQSEKSDVKRTSIKPDTDLSRAQDETTNLLVVSHASFGSRLFCLLLSLKILWV